MSDVVSQEEMDSILSSVPIKEQEQVTVEQKQPMLGYDFNQKDRLKKETKKNLEHIHDTFTKEIGAYVSSKLRIDAIVKLVSIDQLSMDEILESMGNPACLFNFRLVEQNRSAVFELNPELVFYILDKILGGPGKIAEFERDLTKIEQTIIKQFINEFLRILSEAWKSHATFETEITHYHSNAHHLHVAENGESIVSLTFEFEMGEVNQLMSLMYPYFLIEKLLPPEIYQADKKRRPPSPQDFNTLKQSIEQTPLPVLVKLGKTKLSVKELLSLKTGDVIMLDKRVQEELELGIGNKSRFYGKAGLFHDHLAFKVTRKIQYY